LQAIDLIVPSKLDSRKKIPKPTLEMHGLLIWDQGRGRIGYYNTKPEDSKPATVPIVAPPEGFI
jgi:hypothetical protein